MNSPWRHGWLERLLLGAALLLVAGITRAKEPAPAGQCPPRTRTVRVLSAFRHGAGNDAHAAPLPRADALAIIREELARAGVRVTRTDIELQSVRRDCHPGRQRDDDRRRLQHAPECRNGPLRLDGFDRESGVGFVFLDLLDWEALAASSDGCGGCSTCRLQVLEANAQGLPFIAELVAAHAGFDPAIRHLGVFYDPLGDTILESGKKVRPEAMLRSQVRDFVACLRLAGIGESKQERTKRAREVEALDRLLPDQAPSLIDSTP